MNAREQIQLAINLWRMNDGADYVALVMSLASLFNRNGVALVDTGDLLEQRAALIQRLEAIDDELADRARNVDRAAPSTYVAGGGAKWPKRKSKKKHQRS